MNSANEARLINIWNYVHIQIFANKHEHEKEKYHNLSTIVFCCYMTRILHTQFKFTKNAIACDLFMLKYKISFAWFEFNLEKRSWVHTSSRICLYGKRVIAWQEEIWSHMVKYLATIPFQNIICSRILFSATFYLPPHTVFCMTFIEPTNRIRIKVYLFHRSFFI